MIFPMETKQLHISRLWPKISESSRRDCLYSSWSLKPTHRRVPHCFELDLTLGPEMMHNLTLRLWFLNPLPKPEILIKAIDLTLIVDTQRRPRGPPPRYTPLSHQELASNILPNSSGEKVAAPCYPTGSTSNSETGSSISLLLLTENSITLVTENGISAIGQLLNSECNPPKVPPLLILEYCDSNWHLTKMSREPT